MKKINHKKIDKEVYKILSKAMKDAQFIWDGNQNKWILSEKARIEAWARGGYNLNQLVNLAREDMLMALAPDDITGVPFTGSASRRDCDTTVTIAKKIKLPFPLFSSNMESVIGPKLAITLALMGGVGVTHQFQTIEEQTKDIRKVKSAKVNKISIDGRSYEPAIDKDGRLIVAGATGIRYDFMDRIKSIIDAGADIVVLDVAHGDSGQMYDAIKNVRQKFPDVVLMVGNIITPKAAYMFCKAGVDIIKANVGPGYACTTRKITGFGVPTISGLYDVATIAKEFGVDVVGDGGVNDSGIAVKYFATGCKGIMMGTKLGSTSDSPNFNKRYNKKFTVSIKKLVFF